MTRLFATDLDGTLLNAQHECDEIIDKGIQAVFDSGNYFAVATGRHYHQVPVSYSNNKGYYVCLNGSVIADHKGKVMHQELIDKTVLSAFIDQFKSYDFEYISANHIYTFLDCNDHLTFLKDAFIDEGEDISWIEKFMHDNFKNTIYNASKEQILNADICKINLHRREGMDYSPVENYLATSNAIMNTPCDPLMMEITSLGVSKASALKWLAKFLDINVNDVYVYGDGGNDIDMLASFNHSYAPCNASNQAKHVAKTIIGSFEEHSVIQHIESLLKY